jgi:hypothetical protein
VSTPTRVYVRREASAYPLNEESVQTKPLHLTQISKDAKPDPVWFPPLDRAIEDGGDLAMSHLVRPRARRGPGLRVRLERGDAAA